MPEERGLYPKMSIITQLVHFGRLAGMGRREARDAAMSWLDQLGLADRSKDRLDTLSHGNQQRVQLAAALVHGPQVLVLDEPFSGLDPVGVGEMGAVLREAAARGATILFSSHQLELVEDLCVDVAIINGGVTVAHGDLGDDPVPGGVPPGRGDSRRVPVGARRRWVRSWSGGERPHVMVPATVTAEELLAAAGRRARSRRSATRPPSLADLFHEAVQAGRAGRTAEPLPARGRRASWPRRGSPMSSGIGLIARREFVERGRSRVFIGVLIGSMLADPGGHVRGVPGGSSGSVRVGDAGRESPPGLADEVQRVAADLGVDVVVVDSASVGAGAGRRSWSGSVDAALIDGDTILAVGAPSSSVDAVLRGAATAAARVEAAQQLGLSRSAVDTVIQPVVVVVEDLSSAGPGRRAGGRPGGWLRS